MNKEKMIYTIELDTKELNKIGEYDYIDRLSALEGDKKARIIDKQIKDKIMNNDFYSKTLFNRTIKIDEMPNLLFTYRIWKIKKILSRIITNIR